MIMFSASVKRKAKTYLGPEPDKTMISHKAAGEGIGCRYTHLLLIDKPGVL